MVEKQCVAVFNSVVFRQRKGEKQLNVGMTELVDVAAISELRRQNLM